MAGSVRRGRAHCNDIDVVFIPKAQELWNFLISYVRESNGRAKWENSIGNMLKDFEPMRDDRTMLLLLPKCRLHLFLADEDNFGTRLMRHTGSPEHNHFIYRRAKSLGYQWDCDFALYRNGQVPLGKTEEEIYDALEMPFLEPTKREWRFMDSLQM
jgi:DNA polymerase/3'-5' exonuclease PolX